MNLSTFEFNGITVTVREELGSDLWDEETIEAVLGTAIDGHPVWRLQKFYNCIIRTIKIEGDFPFEWPISATDRKIIAAYEGWRALPRELLKRWDEALQAANIRPGDKDIQPIQPGEALPPPQS